MFDGRIAEDFKLSSGTFVSVNPLRTELISTSVNVTATKITDKGSINQRAELVICDK